MNRIPQRNLPARFDNPGGNDRVAGRAGSKRGGLRPAVPQDINFTRNILDQCPEKHAEELKGRLRDGLRASSLDLARRQTQQLVEEFHERAAKAVEVLEEGFEDAIAVSHLPGKVRLRGRTTNDLERRKEEIRSRRHRDAYEPNDASAHRLTGGLLMDNAGNGSAVGSTST